MAQIHEQTITIKLSKLVRTGDKAEIQTDETFAASIEAVVTELVADESVIVEVVED